MSIIDFHFFDSLFFSLKMPSLGKFYIIFRKFYHFTQKFLKIANEKKRAFKRKRENSRALNF